VSKHTTSGTLINGSLVTGLRNPFGVAVLGSEVFVSSFSPISIVGAYTTSGAVIDSNLIAGLNRPYGIAVVADIPEPSGIALGGVAIAAFIPCFCRRKK
jgi:hypothetical protein